MGPRRRPLLLAIAVVTLLGPAVAGQRGSTPPTTPRSSPLPPAPPNPRLDALKTGSRRRRRVAARVHAADGRQPLQLQRARIPGSRDAALCDRRAGAGRLRRPACASRACRRRGSPSGDRAIRSSRSAPTSTGCRRPTRRQASSRARNSCRARPATAKGHNAGQALIITAALAREEDHGPRQAAGHAAAVAGRRRGSARLEGALRARRHLQGRRCRALHARRQRSRHELGRRRRHRHGVGRVHVHRIELACGGGAVARQERARRRRADGHRLEFQARAPADCSSVRTTSSPTAAISRTSCRRTRRSGTTSARPTTTTSRSCGISATRWPRRRR